MYAVTYHALKPYTICKHDLVMEYVENGIDYKQVLNIFLVTDYCCIYAYADYRLSGFKPEPLTCDSIFEEQLAQMPPNFVDDIDVEQYDLDRFYDAWSALY